MKPFYAWSRSFRPGIVIVAIVCAALVTMVAGCETEQANKNSRYGAEIGDISRIIAADIEQREIPGVSIAFYKDDFEWSAGFGYADLENKVSATADTKYRLASMTKPMTAVGILKLQEQGKLNIEDEVQKYVPYFPQKQWPVKIKHLLGNMSGVSHYRDYVAEGRFTTHFTTEESIGVFKDWDLLFEPGDRFQYTSYGFNLLGASIEGASGQSYADYMRENVWNPLGMDNTVMDIASEIIPNRTSGYRKLDGKIANADFLDISSRFSSGGTLSTVKDMLNFARGLEAGKVLSRDTLEMMYTPMVSNSGRRLRYAMGWFPDAIGGHWVVEHSGGQAGTSTQLFIFPRMNFAVVAMTNLQNSSAPNDYCQLVIARILDSYTPRLVLQHDSTVNRIQNSWQYGMKYFSRYAAPQAENPDDLAESFAYFNAIPDEMSEAAELLDQGIHPAFGDHFIKVGSYMAKALLDDKGSLDDYHASGPVPFFADYIALYKDSDSIPAAMRFTPAFEDKITALAAEWQEIWTDDIKALNLLPVFESLEDVTAFRDRFAGKAIQFNFAQQFNALAYTLKGKEETEQGLQVLLAALELYPWEANLYDSAGEFYRALGNREKAIEYYRFALEKNPGMPSAVQALSELEAE